MIKLIIFDIDGTLTDGNIIYSSKDNEIKNFNVKDGLGINSWLRLGRKIAFITGRESKIVKRRADELGINYLKQGCKDKLKTLKEILKEENLNFENVAIMGDDLNDLAMIKNCENSFCPSDANYIIQKNVKTVLKSCGGAGAGREMIDILIQQEKLEDKLLKLWQ